MPSSQKEVKGRAALTSWELPAKTRSLCPQCLSRIDALLYIDSGRVFMNKSCSEHGQFHELISSDSEFFLKMRRAAYREQGPRLGARCASTGECPTSCGLCEQHASTPMMVNIDLTNRCNLHCPVCFANSQTAGKVYELTLDQLKGILDSVDAAMPFTASCFQFVGGEPTIHPHFFEALAMVRDRGFGQIQVASNGLRFAADPEFAFKAADAGLDVVYLQFDGMTDDVYRQTRNRDLAYIKFKAIENISKSPVRVVLVPTIIKGVNDHQLGDILKYAIRKASAISGISWQPVAITGRIDEARRLEMRFTLADLARCLEEQTGLVNMHRDWWPYSVTVPFCRLFEAMSNQPGPKIACHPHCGCASYLFVDTQTGRTASLPAMLDIEPAMQLLDKTAAQIKRFGWMKKVSLAQAFAKLRKYYHPEAAPPGWSFDDFAAFLGSFNDFAQKRRSSHEYAMNMKKERFQPLLLAAMHFQDGYNYEIDRVQHCVVQYAAHNGRMYPFCTWNSGPCHRKTIEEELGAKK